MKSCRFQQQMEITSSAILRLQRQSKHIGEILTVIQEVVDQTNLLSLNASIISGSGRKSWSGIFRGGGRNQSSCQPDFGINERNRTIYQDHSV